MAILHNVKTRAEALAAFSAVDDWQSNPHFPQHEQLGKRNGGMAVTTFPATRQEIKTWVWNTGKEWHAEIVQ